MVGSDLIRALFGGRLPCLSDTSKLSKDPWRAHAAAVITTLQSGRPGADTQIV